MNSAFATDDNFPQGYLIRHVVRVSRIKFSIKRAFPPVNAYRLNSGNTIFRQDRSTLVESIRAKSYFAILCDFANIALKKQIMATSCLSKQLISVSLFAFKNYSSLNL